MSDILIIAPTHNYRRQPDQVLTNSTIVDMTDASIVKEKMVARIPIANRKAPANTTFKQYQDMRMIHAGILNSENDARRRYIEREKTKTKNMTYFPDTGSETNTKYIRGLNVF